MDTDQVEDQGELGCAARLQGQSWLSGELLLGQRWDVFDEEIPAKTKDPNYRFYSCERRAGPNSFDRTLTGQRPPSPLRRTPPAVPWRAAPLRTSCQDWSLELRNQQKHLRQQSPRLPPEPFGATSPTSERRQVGVQLLLHRQRRHLRDVLRPQRRQLR